MIHIAKKNTKWNRAHEFKRKNSNRKGVGHPVYIYGKNKRAYKYLLFTSDPPLGQENDFHELKHNIDPSKDGIKKSYVKKRFETARHDAFREADVKYKIHDEDRDLIRKLKK